MLVIIAICIFMIGLCLGLIHGYSKLIQAERELKILRLVIVNLLSNSQLTERDIDTVVKSVRKLNTDECKRIVSQIREN